MASIIQTAFAWLLVLVMPFQALTAVYLDVLGPAHYHAHFPAENEHRHEYGHDHHGHSHGQGDVERHHHQAADSSVVTVHSDGALEFLALEAENTSGWSGSMLVTLVGEAATPQLSLMSARLTPPIELLLQTRFPGRLERPPRTNPA